jgi:Na+/melibiose symporter-like transporter
MFPLITLVSSFVAYEYKKIPKVVRTTPAKCKLARENWRKVWQFLKLSFIYKPIIFIFLVVIAPGVDDPMFYFNSNILNFTNNEFAYINVISSVGNILGVWTYRIFLRNTSFKNILFITTVCFCIA